MKMTKRLAACLMVTALLSAGCKKKHDEQTAGGSGDSASGASGGGTSDVTTPSAPAAAARALATTAQQGNAELVRAIQAMPAANKAAAAQKLIDALIAYEASIARDRSWDPATVIAASGTDRAKLFAWVHDQTALVPYAGVLRGSVGVMMDRVGNDLDRSLLLANLLTKAGGEARLAHATLDAAAAGKLAAASSKMPHPTLPTTAEDPATAANLVAALGDPAKLGKRFAAETASRAEIAAKSRALVDAQAASLARMIESSPAAPLPDAAAFTDHWWVQIKDGDAWTDLDLAVDSPGTSLVAATETMAVSEIPDRLRHTLAVRVVGELWHDGKRDEKVLVEHAFTPAEFYGQRLLIANVPLDLPDEQKLAAEKDRPAAVKAAFVAETEWLPIVQLGATPIAHFTVTDGGEMFDITDPNEATTRLARGVAKATKNGVGGATDMLEGMPDGTGSAPPPKKPSGPTSGFTAEWIEIEVRAPNVPSRMVRRTIFDAMGAPANRTGLKPILLGDAAKLDRGFALMGGTEVLPQFAKIPAGYLADRYAKYLTAIRPTLVALAQNDGKDPADELKTLVNQALPPPSDLDELAVSRFTSGSANVFIDQLDVLTARRYLISDKGVLKTHSGFDIVTNGVGAWGTPVEARTARITQGVADTVAESVLRPCVGTVGVCFRGPNTSDAFAAAKGWSLTSGAASPVVSQLPADAKLVAANDLANGYAIVASPDGHPATWWRIRVATGETLGQGAAGGTEYTEALMILFRILGVGFALEACYFGADGIRSVGCAVGVGLVSFGSFSLAQAAGAAVAAFIAYLNTFPADGP